MIKLIEVFGFFLDPGNFLITTVNTTAKINKKESKKNECKNC